MRRLRHILLLSNGIGGNSQNHPHHILINTSTSGKFREIVKQRFLDKLNNEELIANILLWFYDGIHFSAPTISEKQVTMFISRVPIEQAR